MAAPVQDRPLVKMYTREKKAYEARSKRQGLRKPYLKRHRSGPGEGARWTSYSEVQPLNSMAVPLERASGRLLQRAKSRLITRPLR